MKRIISVALLFFTQKLVAATLFYGQDLEYDYATNSYVSDAFVTLNEENGYRLLPNQYDPVFTMLALSSASPIPEWVFSIPLTGGRIDEGRYYLSDLASSDTFHFGNQVISINTNNLYYQGYGGYFDVREVTYIPNTVLFNSLAVDFYLLIEGDDYFGALRYNSELSVNPIPLPAAIWLFGSGIICLAGFARKEKARRMR